MDSPGAPVKGPLGIREVLPKSGLVFSERGNLSEVLCKPKILPLKSIVLEQLANIDKLQEQVEDLSNEKEKETSGGLYRNY